MHGCHPVAVICMCPCLRCGFNCRSLHAAGVRRTHVTVAVQSCKECGFQTGSVQCLRCAKAYCDTCYVNKHTLRQAAVDSDPTESNRLGAHRPPPVPTEAQRQQQEQRRAVDAATRKRTRQPAVYTIKVRWREHKTARILQACEECEERTAKFWCRRYAPVASLISPVPGRRRRRL